MNLQRACQLLDLNESDVNSPKLKKQYYLKSLQYHPDKNNSEEAQVQYQAIREAYEYLLEHKDWCNNVVEDDYTNDHEDETLSSYESLIRYFTGTLDEHIQQEYTHIFLQKLLTICEKQALEILIAASDRKFHVAYKILTKYKGVFHLSEHFYDMMEKNKIYRLVQGEMKKRRLYGLVQKDMDLTEESFDYVVKENEPDTVEQHLPKEEEADTEEEDNEVRVQNATVKLVDSEWDLEVELEIPMEITQSSTRATETMILKPTLDDLWENNLYRYTRDQIYLIPLWHHEIVYELNEDTDFVVKIQPKMPSNNIWIDEQNNLHQSQEFSLNEIWGFASKEQCMFAYFGKKRFMFYPHELYMKKYQRIEWKEQGVSKINEDHTFDVSKKANLILHLTVI